MQDEVAFDPVIHVPARLKVMMLLAATTESSFNALAEEARLTAGNLASHLRTLEEAGYVRSRRGLVDLKPRVRYALTDPGRAALKAYCATLELALRRLQGLVDAPPPPPAAGPQDEAP